MGSERGQGTVEWVGTLLVVSVAMLALVAAGVRVPGAPLARALADRILCAASLADGCGDEPALIAAYGSEVGELVRRHMPMLVFEEGSRAVPVDFRRCRSSGCGDAAQDGLVHRTDARLPVTAFVHVVDCRPAAVEETEAAGADCSGERAGNLYVQYWTYYADSATLRGVPVVGEEGYHHDDSRYGLGRCGFLALYAGLSGWRWRGGRGHGRRRRPRLAGLGRDAPRHVRKLGRRPFE